MLQRHDASFLTVFGVLPFALAACTHGTPSDDPRTQSPLVRVATVAPADAADRSFTGIVAARVQSDLGFRVSGWSRAPRQIEGIECFHGAQLDAFLRQTDILVCLLPLTPETRHILNRDLLAKLHRSSPLGRELGGMVTSPIP